MGALYLLSYRGNEMEYNYLPIESKDKATKGNRTLNPRFTIAVLCQLSYCGIKRKGSDLLKKIKTENLQNKKFWLWLGGMILVANPYRNEK